MSNSIYIKDMTSASTEELKVELSKSLQITADHLSYLAAIWSELERRGEDLSALRVGLAVYLPAIAARRLDPSIVIRFAGNKTILKAMSLLSIEDQRRYLDNGTIDVALDKKGVGIVARKIDLKSLTPSIISIAFEEGRVRSVQEQKMLLKKRSAKKKERKPISTRKIIPDKLNKGLRVGDRFISIDKLSKALGDYYDIKIDLDKTFITTNPLSGDEHPNQKTIDLIEDAIDELIEKGKKPTIPRVSDIIKITTDELNSCIEYTNLINKAVDNGL